MVKILLVEDDSNLREIYGARLEAEGFSIISAADGEEALAIAVKERPDLVISDVMMPKISGFDMLDILRSTPETKDVKVIVMTALSQEEDRERGKELGADRYLVKSQVTLDDVVNMVRELVDEPSGTAPLVADDQTAVASDSATNSTTPTNQDVAQFVATSPLMNGTPPDPSADEDDQATTDSETPQQQPPVD